VISILPVFARINKNISNFANLAILKIMSFHFASLAFTASRAFLLAGWPIRVPKTALSSSSDLV